MAKNLFDLTGKTAIVTGATGGLGFASARALADHGAKVILAGRNPEKLKDCERKIDSGSVSCALLKGDSREDWKRFFEENPASILVNSIGVNIPQKFMEVTEEAYDKIMNANVKSALFQTQGFMQAALNNKLAGSVIHISSQMAFVGGLERSVYCASKHAMEGFTKAIALEMGAWNLRINTVCPTFIATELTKSTLENPEKRAWVEDSIALNRIGVPEDIQGAVVYLASDASELVTGTSIRVDAGWTAK